MWTSPIKLWQQPVFVIVILSLATSICSAQAQRSRPVDISFVRISDNNTNKPMTIELRGILVEASRVIIAPRLIWLPLGGTQSQSQEVAKRRRPDRSRSCGGSRSRPYLESLSSGDFTVKSLTAMGPTVGIEGRWRAEAFWGGHTHSFEVENSFGSTEALKLFCSAVGVRAGYSF